MAHGVCCTHQQWVNVVTFQYAGGAAPEDEESKVEIVDGNDGSVAPRKRLAHPIWHPYEIIRRRTSARPRHVDYDSFYPAHVHADNANC